MKTARLKYKKKYGAREEKGNSVIEFPEKYCVVDIETTGLKPEYAEIIEIGAVMIENGRETARFGKLIKPHKKQDNGLYVSSFISGLTGINDDMLKDAPYIEEVLPEFEQFLGDVLIMGYNVSFDVNFIFDNFMKYLNKPLKNDFVDVLRLARKICADMPRHSLSDMTKYYGIEHKNAHRAVSDCVATHECYINLKSDIIKEYGDTEVFKTVFKKRHYRTSVNDIKPDKSKFNPDSPIFGRRISFSGSLRKLNRMNAMQQAADLGAILQNAVTKKTDFLVLSDRERRLILRGEKSRKYILAERFIEAGGCLKVMSEGEFYKVIGLC